MSLTARDVMDDCFQILRPEMSIAEAVKTFDTPPRSGAKVFGLMVLTRPAPWRDCSRFMTFSCSCAPNISTSGEKWRTSKSPASWKLPANAHKRCWWEIL